MIDLGRKKLCIFGTGGFGKEVLLVFIDSLNCADSSSDYRDQVVFMDSDENYTSSELMGVPVIKQSEYDSDSHLLVVAVGEPSTRKKIVSQFPSDIRYATLIHPNAVVSEWVELGEGSIVTAGTILTCDIKIGKHAHLNLHSTVGHDCVIGDFFTTAPGAKISGNCNFGECVYFGTSACVRQGVEICSNTTIGMGGVVVKNISEPGVYIGNPLRALS